MDKIETIKGEIHSVTTLHEMIVRLLADHKEQAILRHESNNQKIEEVTKHLDSMLLRLTRLEDATNKVMCDLTTVQHRFEDSVKTNDVRWSVVNSRSETQTAAVVTNSQEISKLGVRADEAIMRGRERLDQSMAMLTTLGGQMATNMTGVARLTSEAEAARNATESAFKTSEKAIEKSEHAQREYNHRSNEFRGQLEDQAKRLMPREETMAMFRATEDKVSAVSNQLHTRTDGVSNQFESRIVGMAKEVDQLKALMVLDQGKAQGAANTGKLIAASVGLLATLIAICTGVLVLMGQQP